MKPIHVNRPELGKTSIVALCALIVGASSGAVTANTEVSLSGTATDAADENRFFTRVGGTVRDDLTYDGLEAGRTYTVSARLLNMTTKAPVDETTTLTFTPEAASGEISIELPMPQNRTDSNIDYVVTTSIHEGDLDASEVAASEALARLDDTADIDRTLQSHAIQSIDVTAEADGGHTLSAEGGTIDANVEYVNLVAGYAYTIWGQLLTPSGQATGIYASVPDYVPSDKDGALALEFEVPQGWDGIKLTPAVGLYHKKRVVLNPDGSLTLIEGAPVPVMIASDMSVDAPEQTISVGVPFEDRRMEPVSLGK